MCDVCETTPCLSRCPGEYTEPLSWCCQCGEELFEGDEVLETDKTLCSDCLYDMTTDELLAFLGEDKIYLTKD